MNKLEAIRLIHILLDTHSDPHDRAVAAARLKELIEILLPDEEDDQSPIS